MNLFFYATESKKDESQFLKLKHDLAFEFPHCSIQTFLSLDSLAQKLRQPSIDSSVAVLLALSRKELTDILAIKGLLSGKRVVLILPDRDEDTLSQGHQLHPRYLSYADLGFENVSAVLRKMISHLDPQHVILEKRVRGRSKWLNLGHVSYRQLSDPEKVC